VYRYDSQGYKKTSCAIERAMSHYVGAHDGETSNTDDSDEAPAISRPTSAVLEPPAQKMNEI